MREEESKCVVRLTTSFWSNNKGLHMTKSLIYLRRQCGLDNFLEIDADAGGADQAMLRVVNIGEVEDGIYEVVACNKTRDRETGYVDDYDFALFPIKSTGE